MSCLWPSIAAFGTTTAQVKKNKKEEESDFQMVSDFPDNAGNVKADFDESVFEGSISTLLHGSEE